MKVVDLRFREFSPPNWTKLGKAYEYAIPDIVNRVSAPFLPVVEAVLWRVNDSVCTAIISFEFSR